jgi:hypothetical protein
MSGVAGGHTEGLAGAAGFGRETAGTVAARASAVRCGDVLSRISAFVAMARASVLIHDTVNQLYDFVNYMLGVFRWAVHTPRLRVASVS